MNAPWTVSKSASPDWLYQASIHDANGARVAIAFDDAATAQLIAAAPVLLAALQKIDSNAAESAEWIRRVARDAMNEVQP
jgi:hypothetical protein